MAHSDTVFSCLINAYAQLHSGDPKAVNNLLAPFHKGKTTVSHFRRHFRSKRVKTEIRYYLPRPLVDPLAFYDSRGGQNARKNYGKLIRNLPLVSIEKFRAYWLGEGQTHMGRQDLEAAKQEVHNFCCLPTIRPQHTRDRLTDATAIYHTGLVYFASNSGLYFLIEINDTSLLSWNENFGGFLTWQEQTD